MCIRDRYEDVTPDILVTGKGLTSGYVPGSAVLCRSEIGEADVYKRQAMTWRFRKTGIRTVIQQSFSPAQKAKSWPVRLWTGISTEYLWKVSAMAPQPVNG